MKDIERRYQLGQVINASEFNTDEGLETFGTVVWDDWEEDKATAQEHLFDNDVSWQKVHPLQEEPSDKEKHLSRPTELKNGVTRMITTDRLDRALEAQSLANIRAELARMDHEKELDKRIRRKP